MMNIQPLLVQIRFFVCSKQTPQHNTHGLSAKEVYKLSKLPK
uniref:Uncharacterized protein n=1 Tax=Anguilla anguilla TaxID=7936 RepID=A0A0E9QUE4_ANGAN